MDPTSSTEASYEDAIRFRAKRELRKRMRSLRSALPASAIAERSRLLVANLIAHPLWTSANTIALFMSLPDEVQLASAIDAARAENKTVALPVVVDASATLVFRAPYDATGTRELHTSAFGIAEPGDDSCLVPLDSIDLVVLPALAVDPRGHRIGYGAGYYDHSVPLMTRAATIAVAFDFQLIAEVPIRAGDIPAQFIITDRRVMRAEP